MNLLIVDDEVDAIQTVINKVDWSRLPFSHRYTATSKAQAIEQITTRTIDVLLCDIEMPRGSGLELLEWINQEGHDIACIFMTCHADFSYAQQAIQLGSEDYVLKPLDFQSLGDTLGQTAKKLAERRRLQQIDSHWADSQREITRQFWRKLFSGDIAANRESMLQYWSQQHLDFPVDNQFLPLLLVVKRWEESVSKEDQKLFSYALRNVADEIFTLEQSQREVIPLGEDKVLVLLSLEHPQAPAAQKETLDEHGRAVVRVAEEYLSASVCCYVGEAVEITQLPQQLDQLVALDFNNVLLSEQVIFLRENITRYQEHQGEHYTLWHELVAGGQYNTLRRTIEEELAKALAEHRLTREYLSQMSGAFYVVLFEYSLKNSLYRKELFRTEEAARLSQNASDSMEDFLQWVKYSTHLLEGYDKERTQVSDPVEQAKAYIEANLEQELTVESVAEAVYLHPDYLNRIFKREEGQVISRYITEQKIQRAKWLLTHTEHDIGEVAARVGYYNYSSFRRNFTRLVNMSPSEYKSKMIENNDQ